MSMSGVLSRAPERPGPAREGDVDRGDEDVQVLRVRHEHQEPHDHGDVQDEEHRDEHAVDPRAERREGLRHEVGGERPVAVGELGGLVFTWAAR